MKGQEQILEARHRGMKPSTMVFVDVGQHTGWQKFLLEQNARMLNDTEPMNPHVCLAPTESARTADWSWCVGLRIQLDGTDPVRVMAAFERIKAAGAERVIATCDDAPWLFMDTDFKEAA
jgi:hypothetical protein